MIGLIPSRDCDDNPPHLGQPYKEAVHSGNFGAGIEPKLKEVGIEYELNYNNDYGHMKYPNLFDFFKVKLRAGGPR